MSTLKREPKNQEIAKGVFQDHHITRLKDGLTFIELRLLRLDIGGVFSEELKKMEACIVVLEGKIAFSSETTHYSHLGKRKSIFEKVPTDSIYISNKNFVIKAEEAAKVILCYSPTDQMTAATVIPAEENLVENRGEHQNKRLVHNILDDTSAISDKLLVVEVFTDSGNWSSYPPHKHDQDNLPEESFLEETYYHEINPSQGFIFQRVYTDNREIDETMTVENREVVLVPKGYHPVSVPEGYDGYYLNIMAGPIKKWQFKNDPNHEWLLKKK